MCKRAAEHTDAKTNERAERIWHAAFAAQARPESILVLTERAYRIELLFRALVVVMARRGG